MLRKAKFPVYHTKNFMKCFLRDSIKGHFMKMVSQIYRSQVYLRLGAVGQMLQVVRWMFVVWAEVWVGFIYLFGVATKDSAPPLLRTLIWIHGWGWRLYFLHSSRCWILLVQLKENTIQNSTKISQRRHCPLNKPAVKRISISNTKKQSLENRITRSVLRKLSSGQIPGSKLLPSGAAINHY